MSLIQVKADDGKTSDELVVSIRSAIGKAYMGYLLRDNSDVDVKFVPPQTIALTPSIADALVMYFAKFKTYFNEQPEPATTKNLIGMTIDDELEIVSICSTEIKIDGRGDSIQRF